jgi:hypothetical protein
VERHEERTRRARRSAVRLFVAGVVEAAAGAAVAAFWEEQQVGGLLLATTGAGHALTGAATFDLANRRRRSFDERVAWAEAHPDSWAGLREAAVFAIDRDARANAYGAGLWSGVGLAGAGAAAFALDPGDQGAGAALALGGLVGVTHHATRWGASTRLGWELRRAESWSTSPAP